MGERAAEASRSDRRSSGFVRVVVSGRGLTVGAAVVTGVAAALRYATSADLAQFAVSALALALLAALIGRATDELGRKTSPAAAGILQSALGNLPELTFSIFALRAGLLPVVQAALVGSVLGNVLLVLGLAFLAGGLRHGTQRFGAEQARALALMLVLAVAVAVVPTVAAGLPGPISHHRRALSSVAAVVLLSVYGLNVAASVRAPRRLRGPIVDPTPGTPGVRRGGVPLISVLLLLGASAVAAALVSEWLVHALGPAISALGITEAFSGLVIVAIASNAVEHAVGVSMAARNQSDLALSVILQSPLQVLLVLMPVLALASPAIGGAELSFVFPPRLIVSLVLATAVTVVVVFDGESTWTEGVALLGLYGVVAASFWWG